jgi:hypothetical protein
MSSQQGTEKFQQFATYLGIEKKWSFSHPEKVLTLQTRREGWFLELVSGND